MTPRGPSRKCGVSVEGCGASCCVLHRPPPPPPTPLSGGPRLLPASRGTGQEGTASRRREPCTPERRRGSPIQARAAEHHAPVPGWRLDTRAVAGDTRIVESFWKRPALGEQGGALTSTCRRLAGSARPGGDAGSRTGGADTGRVFRVQPLVAQFRMVPALTTPAPLLSAVAEWGRNQEGL